MDKNLGWILGGGGTFAVAIIGLSVGLAVEWEHQKTDRIDNIEFKETTNERLHNLETFHGVHHEHKHHAKDD